MIPRLRLDYQRPARARPWAGIALFVAGLGAAGAVVARHADLLAATETVNADLARLRRQVASAPTPTSAVDLPSGAISTAPPWAALLDALDAAADETVALLALQPGAGNLRLDGEARDMAALFDYLKRLQAAPLLADALLTQSETSALTPAGAAPPVVRFVLVVPWAGSAP